MNEQYSRARQTLKRVITAIPVFALAGVVAGCSASAPAKPLGPQAYDFLTVGQFQLDPTLVSAEQYLMQQCMAQKGFKFIPSPPSAPVTAQQLEGTRDLRSRKADGYGLSAAAKNPAQPDANGGYGGEGSTAQDAYVSSLSRTQQADYDLAFGGPDSARRSMKLPDGRTTTYPGAGCVAESNTKLYGDVDLAEKVVGIPNTLFFQVMEKVKSDSKYTAAMDRWARCMQQRNHPYKTPDDAERAISQKYRDQGYSDSLHNSEILTAVDDFECASEAGLMRTFQSLKRQYANELGPDEQRALLQLVEAKDAALARAKEIIARGTP